MPNDINNVNETNGQGPKLNRTRRNDIHASSIRLAVSDAKFGNPDTPHRAILFSLKSNLKVMEQTVREGKSTAEITGLLRDCVRAAEQLGIQHRSLDKAKEVIRAN